MKLPDTQNAVYSGNMSVQDCEVACKNNCSCTAYANPNVTPGGVGCLRWFGELTDVRVYPQNGQDLYVRLAASELLDRRLIAPILGRPMTIRDKDNKGSSQNGKIIDVPLFSLSIVSKATNNFSVDNKLGEGGFGPVYKRAEDRPNTLSVVSMLGGEGLLPSPKPPGFFIQGSENGSPSVISLPPSDNGVTLSLVEGR
ncbi:putative S-locus glycoprotein domain-containing protein [Tanacetum coccineum]